MIGALRFEFMQLRASLNNQKQNACQDFFRERRLK